MTHTLLLLVQDRPGVLNRIASVFRRRDINIESLTAEKSEEAGVSRMTLVVETDNIVPTIAQLEKLIDVFEVHTPDTHRSPGLPPDRPLESVPHSTSSSTKSLWAQADGDV